MEKNKKIAFVTGGSRGIGRAIVEKLGEDGYTVGFSYINSDEKAEAFVEELKSKGVEAFKVKFDVACFDDCELAFEKIYEEYENIDVLINNAGITKDKLFVRMKEEDFNEVVNTNLKGVFNVTKQVVKKMTKNRSGRIVNMSSISGIFGNMGQANYSASKAGLVGFTKTLAKELGSYNITVNAIAPGFIKTDMTDILPDKVKEKILEDVPLRKMGQPEDIANAVSFLASEGGRYITGQVISIDGGMS